jgi:hypothetical protein
MIAQGGKVVVLTGKSRITFLTLLAAGSKGAPIFPDATLPAEVRRLRNHGIKIRTLRRDRLGRQHTRYVLDQGAGRKAVRRRPGL